MESCNFTEILAKNITKFPLSSVPAEAINEAKRSFLNWLGVTIGAINHSSVNMVLEIAEEIGGPPQATILGRKIKTDILFASLINGMSSHIFDYDDTLLNTVLHPSAPVWPAILALGEYKNYSTKDLLAAFVLGCEVEQRIALAIYPSHYDRGWHITGTVGAFGSASAVGKLLNLNEKQMINALGLAATQPTGLREMFGTMTKPFHPGKAASNGLLSALLAQKGFTSSTASLEAKRGYCQVTSENPKLEIISEPWGDNWKILENSYKPFACGIVTHPGIDAGIKLNTLHKIKPEQIESISLEVHPLVLELTGKTEPRNQLEAKFSIYHCVAVAIIFGNASERQFADEIVTREDVINLRQKIKAKSNNSLKEDQVILSALLTNGEEIRICIEHAIGSKYNPMTNEQLELKFKEITSSILKPDLQTEIIKKIWHMDEDYNVRELIELINKN